ncbi:MAG: hypothetical protein LBG52_07730 [Candidatus Peribacteria bacterium]|jgi:hypothetical protein|nr:hypothetical protein [Candidatus Peribacteria bacterium]
MKTIRTVQVIKQKKTLFLLGILLFSFLFLLSSVSAYTPTDTDTKQLTDLKTTLSSVEATDLRKYYQQFAILQKAIANRDARLDYLLSNLRDWSYTQFTKKKDLVVQQSKPEKANFINQYLSGLLLTDPVYSNCVGRYNTLDNLSFANNFPTALTIATRYRESTCSYALPRNGDGPFQIVNKDYGTGAITEELFLQTVQDFLDFSRNKINRYNQRNAASGFNISLSYTGATQKDLLRFSALYNGISGASVYGDITPAAPKYFREGYKTDVWTGESKKDGMFAEYLKVVQWEQQQ